jgi:hypothetical protein
MDGGLMGKPLVAIIASLLAMFAFLIFLLFRIEEAKQNCAAACAPQVWRFDSSCECATDDGQAWRGYES